MLYLHRYLAVYDEYLAFYRYYHYSTAMRSLRLLLFFFAFSLFVLFCSGTIDSQDGFQYLAVARNMYYVHRPTAPPLEYPQKNVYMNVNQASDGSWYSPTGAGYSIAMIPAVALSDLLHRLYHVAPPVHFPLETDWAVLLFASFTNAFFAALLVVYLFDYLLLLDVQKHTALIGSLLSIIATNLFPIAKESFAHMMYITFLIGAFYFVKKYSITHHVRDIVLASINFGVVIVAYNPIFVLAVLPLALYHVLLSHPRFERTWFQSQILPAVFGMLSILPFVGFYLWYNAIRTGTAVNSGYGLPAVSNFKANFHILYEGLYGLLFSPGRGFFLYSPLLLILGIFWHKLTVKKYLAEFLSFGFLSLSYLYFYAIQNGGPDWYQWNGESSWGPRYIALLIPFLMIFVVCILGRLQKWERRIVLYPLILVSVGVQMLGILLPYQIKFHDLSPEFRLNGVRFTTADYANFIPRYSPLINMPRELAKRLIEFPETRNHGIYNVRFIDGFDFPFKLGNREQWRGIHQTAYFSLNAPDNHPVTKMKIGFSNTRLDPTSSYSAILRLLQGDTLIASGSAKADTWGEFSTATDKLTGKQEFILETQFVGTPSAKQVVFIRSLDINDTPVSLKTLDMPYVQPLSQAMTDAKYRYFGKIETNPWFYWNMHSEVYEGTLDLWWVKALYYWDLPKSLFGVLFAIDIGVMVFTAYELRLSFKRRSTIPSQAQGSRKRKKYEKKSR